MNEQEQHQQRLAMLGRARTLASAAAIEGLIQQGIDEEGCSAVFTHLKTHVWGHVTGDADGDMQVTAGDAGDF